MSDGCMHTALLLLDCTLDDMRPGRGGKITRCRVCLLLLSVKGRAMSDGCIHTALLLLDCTLDDMRPGRGGKITRCSTPSRVQHVV
ncbi:unnamed protein product [Plutella xylostella]|uniref:(diamondback moth) hypothetical protein n=1 Tax=Plutella xylostella TaxID=51655 RepID=A0A8S4G8A5_PLUXY|nr:unnamed protein product [Plutella xylostella]